MRKTLTDRTLFLPLTGLRGLAVIFVLLSHMGYMQLYLIPLPHFSIGKVGVWVFFVLSAFLLTTHLYQDFSTNDSRRVVLSKYAINRIFRIYPLFIVALILHFLVGDITGIQIIKHIFLTMGYFELWAIPVEVKYYFFIPVLAAIASLISLKLACLSIIVLMGIALMYGISNPQSVFSNQLSIIPKLTPFLFGSFSAILYLKGRGRANGTNKFLGL